MRLALQNKLGVTKIVAKDIHCNNKRIIQICKQILDMKMVCHVYRLGLGLYISWLYGRKQPTQLCNLHFVITFEMYVSKRILYEDFRDVETSYFYIHVRSRRSLETSN